MMNECHHIYTWSQTQTSTQYKNNTMWTCMKRLGQDMFHVLWLKKIECPLDQLNECPDSLFFSLSFYPSICPVNSFV